MSTISQITPGDTISFKLKTNVLKDDFTNVIVHATATYTAAMTIEDVSAIHANIYSTLPEGTPKTPQEYNYLIVEDLNKRMRAVGIPWIREPVTIVQSCTLVITVSNASVDDADVVRNALSAYGIEDYVIEVQSHENIKVS